MFVVRVPRIRVVLGVVVLAAVLAPVAPAPGPDVARVAVVLTLRDESSAGAASWKASQDAVLSVLPGPRPTRVQRFRSVDGLRAEITSQQRSILEGDPRVAEVALDVPSAGRRPAARTAPPAATASLGPAPAPTGACTGTRQNPQLEPEALQTMHVRSDGTGETTAASLGFAGTGVKVGVVSTNLDPNAADFLRGGGESAVTDYRSYVAQGLNANGQGAEAFGDVSAIVAQGKTRDLSNDVDPAAVALPGGHCWIRVVGVAPMADVEAANVYDLDNVTPGSLVAAMDEMIARRVDVINLSLGGNVYPETAPDLAFQAVEDAAVAAGITVVESSGDAGGDSTINSPTVNPNIISVGTSLDSRVLAQTGGQAMTRFAPNGWSNRTLSGVGSAGFSTTGRTIDLVAPGDFDWSVCSTDKRFVGCSFPGTRQSDLFPFAGSSQSAPFVTGVAALVIQAYRSGHGGRSPAPAQVKRLLTGTASDLGLPGDQQGAGLVNARAAVLAAQRLPGTGASLSATTAAAVADGVLVPARTQLSEAGNAGQSVTLSTTVTNTGATPVTVGPVSLTADRGEDRRTYPVAVTGTGDSFLDGMTGLATHFTTQRVALPAGRPWVHVQLTAATALPLPIPASPGILAIDPLGRLAGRATSVGNGVQVWLPTPAAGTWTFVVQAQYPLTGQLVIDLGRRDVLAVGDAVLPVLAPGASTAVTATVALPPGPGPGDVGASLRVGNQLALPVVLRTRVPLHGGTAVLSAPALPGNGRGGAPTQTRTWEFDVPAGTRSLHASLQLSDHLLALLNGVLIDPTGRVRSVGANSFGASGKPTAGFQQTVLDPAPGSWRFVALVFHTVYLTPVLDSTIIVQIGLDTAGPDVTGLPAGERITAGTTRTATVTVTNPGPVPITVFLDPRRATDQVVPLTPATGTANPVLPVSATTQWPVFVVPPFSTALQVAVRATVPTILGLNGPTGTPGLVATTGLTPVTEVTGADAIPGPWSVQLSVPGPVGRQPSPAGRASVEATVRTKAFDPSVTDARGLAWTKVTGVQNAAAAVTIAPGATGTLTAVLTAADGPGTSVSGFLAVETAATAVRSDDDLVARTGSGDVLAVLPYAYTVGETPATHTTSTPPTHTSASVPTGSAGTPATAVHPTATPTSTTSDRRQLSATGFTAAPLAWPAAGLLILGAGLVLLGRIRTRRRSDPAHRPSDPS